MAFWNRKKKAHQEAMGTVENDDLTPLEESEEPLLSSLLNAAPAGATDTKMVVFDTSNLDDPATADLKVYISGGQVVHVAYATEEAERERRLELSGNGDHPLLEQVQNDERLLELVASSDLELLRRASNTLVASAEMTWDVDANVELIERGVTPLQIPLDEVRNRVQDANHDVDKLAKLACAGGDENTVFRRAEMEYLGDDRVDVAVVEFLESRADGATFAEVVAGVLTDARPAVCSSLLELRRQGVITVEVDDDEDSLDDEMGAVFDTRSLPDYLDEIAVDDTADGSIEVIDVEDDNDEDNTLSDLSNVHYQDLDATLTPPASNDELPELSAADGIAMPLSEDDSILNYTLSGYREHVVSSLDDVPTYANLAQKHGI